MKILKVFSFSLIILLAYTCKTSKEAPTNVVDTDVTERSVAPEGQGQGAADRQAAMETLIADLGLNAEQEAQFKAINKKYRDQMREVRQNNQGDFQAIRGSMQEIRGKQEAELKEFLDADQFAKYQKWVEENRPQRGRRPPGGF